MASGGEDGGRGSRARSEISAPGSNHSARGVQETPVKPSSNLDFRSTARLLKFGKSIGSATNRRKKMLRSSTTVQSDEGNTLAALLNLSCYQEQLLVQSWSKIHSSAAAKAGQGIFQELCAKNENAKGFFQKALIVGSFKQRAPDMKAEHGRMLMELLDLVIKSLRNHPQEVVDMVRDYGVTHAGLRQQGLNNACWDALGDAILDFVRKQESVRKHRDLSRAWMQIISYLMDKMKEGQQIGLSALNSGYPLSARLNRRPSKDRRSSPSPHSPATRSRSVPESPASPQAMPNRSETLHEDHLTGEQNCGTGNNSNRQSPVPHREAGASPHENEDNADRYTNGRVQLPTTPTQTTKTVSFVRSSSGRTLADALNLSAYQLSLLQSTWPKIIGGAGMNIGSNIFSDLIQRSGAISGIFQKYTIVEGFTAGGAASRRDHGRFLTEFLDFVIDGLSGPAEIFEERCADISEAHGGLRADGMTSGEWNTVADTILAHICKCEPVRKSRELTRAWMIIITVVVDKLR